MPHVSVQNTMWIFTSPDGSQVERYIVEFVCRVRNITFVEKYISVSANSGGTGRVARSESCFGGLGQLYRVKVWAVSGHNISQQPAVRCLTADGQCREGRRLTLNVVYFLLYCGGNWQCGRSRHCSSINVSRKGTVFLTVNDID